MGKRGPPKKPTALKLIQGTPGGVSNLTKNEPKPPKTKAAQPSINLNSTGKKIWARLIPQLEALGLLTEIDVNTLSRYADMFARWQDAREFINEHGFAYEFETESGSVVRSQYPEVGIYNQLGRDLIKLEQQFGMTPSARASLSIEPEKKKSKHDELRSRLYGD